MMSENTNIFISILMIIVAYIIFYSIAWVFFEFPILSIILCISCYFIYKKIGIVSDYSFSIKNLFKKRKKKNDKTNQY